MRRRFASCAAFCCTSQAYIRACVLTMLFYISVSTQSDFRDSTEDRMDHRAFTWLLFFHVPVSLPFFCQAASVFTTAIVTGRSKDKVYDFVGLENVFYAGSHGLEIQGPQETPFKCQVQNI